MTALETALAWTGLLLGLWGVLSALQTLSDLGEWRDAGPLGQSLQRLRRQRPVMRRIGDAVWTQRGLGKLAFAQLILSLAISFAPGPVFFAALFAVTLVLTLRIVADGADKMAMVVASGALLQSLGLAWNRPMLVLAGVLWTGGQLTIAYFASGASKAVIARWRSGAALRDALSSYQFGHRYPAAVLVRPWLAWVIAWIVIAVEALFPLALLLPWPGLAAVLAGFFLLHLAIAAFLGLNTYPLAFAAAYPSVLLLGQWLRAGLGLA